MFQGFKDMVVNAFDKTSTSIEGIHKSLAGLPLDVMAKFGAFENTANSIKDIQEESISKVYEMTRNVNQQLGDFADTLLSKNGEEES